MLQALVAFLICCAGVSTVGELSSADQALISKGGCDCTTVVQETGPEYDTCKQYCAGKQEEQDKAGILEDLLGQ
jgi:hypothetical protein